MPKKAEYQIVWSRIQKGYEVVHGSFRFLLLHSSLDVWLDLSDTFHVCSSTGQTFTLRKEAKQRGGGYWYGYKRVRGRVEKKYIGEKSKVTIEALEAVARHFAELTSPPLPPPPPPRPSTLKFEKTLQSALYIYGFSTIPARKELLLKYRELSKRHHPDMGGVHEDMVAVNLAYDYLKKFVS
jgi:hypothetical protein